MSVVVGTAGHIDHGKTTLLRALTGIDADRLPEERRRGMTIDVGYAHLTLEDGSMLDFVDVPGHDRLVGNMLVGAGEIDAVLLVVAADDGPRAQTIEHLELLDALGIGEGVVALTKTDLLGGDEARRADVERRIRALLEATTLEGAPVVAVSAATGEGLPRLRAELERLARRLTTEGASRGHPAAASRPGETGAAPLTAPRPAAGRIRLPVDRVFAVRGRGAVVTGSLRGGRTACGATLRIEPGGTQVRIRELQVHGETRSSAGPGRTALNLASVEAEALRRGLVLTDDPAVVASDRLLVALRPSVALPAAPAGGPAEARVADAALRRRPPSAWPPAGTFRLHVGTDQVDARLGRGPRWSAVAPSGERIASLRLAQPVAVAPGDRFVLRRPSPAATVGGGRVLDVDPPRGPARRRATPERLLALAAGDPERPGVSSAALLDLHGSLPLARWTAVGGQGRPAVGGLVLAPDVMASLVDVALARVAAHHAVEPDSAGVPVPDLRRTVATELRRRASVGASEASAAAAALVDGLVGAGHLARSAGLVRDPARVETVPPALAAAMDRLEASLATPSPPPFAEAVRAAGCPAEGVRRLEVSGRIVRLTPELAFAASTYRALESLALGMADAGPVTPAALRDATATSRRYVLAVLEDLDRRGLLVRTPAGHVRGSRR